MWMAYRERHGSFNAGLRVEMGAALVAHTVACVAPRTPGSAPPSLQDFLPQRVASLLQAPQEDILAQAMKAW